MADGDVVMEKSPSPALPATRLVQVANISPSATRDQLYSLLSYLGRISELKLYPLETNPFYATYDRKVCYCRYDESGAVPIVQHLTNTVFIDRALVCVPVPEGVIPDEDTALKMGVPGQAGSRKLPPNVVNQIQMLGNQQVIVTIDPNLSAKGLPAYPPLPANTDASRIEEIRRTIYVGEIPKETTSAELMDFLNEKIGEVMYLRFAGDDTLPWRYAYVEFSQIASVSAALTNVEEFKGVKLKFQHSTQAVLKPQAKTLEAAQKEVEEAMKRTSSSHQLVGKAIDDVSKTASRETSRSSRRSRSGSRDRHRRRSRSPSGERIRNVFRDRFRRSRSRSGSRSRRRRSRTRSRDRRRRRSRSRSTDKRPARRSRTRSRSRDRKEKETRSRSRDRKEKEPRSRSRDRKEKEPRSRSRDRKEKEKSSSRRSDNRRDRRSAERDKEREREREKESSSRSGKSRDRKADEEESRKKKRRSRSPSEERVKERRRKEKKERKDSDSPKKKSKKRASSSEDETAKEAKKDDAKAKEKAAVPTEATTAMKDEQEKEAPSPQREAEPMETEKGGKSPKDEEVPYGPAIPREKSASSESGSSDD